VSVPGSEYETTVSVHPDSSADREDSDSIDEEDEEGGSHVTRQMVVRFFDEKRPNALLRLRITRSESASVPCVVTVEEADAQANTAAAASHRGEFLFTFVWAIMSDIVFCSQHPPRLKPCGRDSVSTRVTAPSRAYCRSNRLCPPQGRRLFHPPSLERRRGPSRPACHQWPPRVMTPMLPRRLR